MKVLVEIVTTVLAALVVFLGMMIFMPFLVISLIFAFVSERFGGPRNSGDLKLPRTFSSQLNLDPSVDFDVDAFGSCILDSRKITVAISESVARSAGINLDESFIGDVEITISGEHEISNRSGPVYTVSCLKK